MSVTRIHKTKDYTVMANYHFREKDMSLKAKGLLSLMLSLPDEWDYSIDGLVLLSCDGKTSVMSALDELRDFGYLTITRETNEKGQFAGYVYDVFETPQKEQPAKDDEEPSAENPYSENPNTEKPNTENQPQLNTNILNTKLSSTKELNIYSAILAYLNEKAGTSFRPNSEATKRKINARMSEGFKLTDFFSVIDKKCAEWKETEFAKYLRPETLFGTKFESYLNAPASPPRKTVGSGGVEIDETAEDTLAGIF